MLSQCSYLLYFGDIPNLVSCAFSTIPIFIHRIFYLLVEKRIEDFLTFYRQQFVGTSITPKLHMIEDHMVDFLRKWRVGCGLLGEQGAESIHIKFNELHRNYSNIRNSEDRLRQVTLEHHRRTSPLLNHYRPLLQHKTRPEE